MDFQRVQRCCKSAKCFAMVYEDLQKQFHLQFLTKMYGSNNTQTCKYCFKKEAPLKFQWQYYCVVDGEKTKVCLQFFSNVLQIGQKRLRTIQQKYAQGFVVIKDSRGCHDNRPHKISSDVWEMVEQHWESIPHGESHYCASKSSRKYFENPELTVMKLYKLFCKLYKQRKHTEVKLDYKTYHRYFKTHSRFSFRKPRTDMCDFCESSKIKLQVNPQDSCNQIYELHKKRVQKYLEIKCSCVDWKCSFLFY
uniref:Uncharacterized protein n=2 Tax=Cacopsylla melanoneura TaxID=428564 RepID=A0A8D8VMW4_9HEMI